MIPTEQLSALLQADLGAWGRDDVDRVATGLGWWLGADDKWRTTLVETDGPYQVRADRRRSWDDRGYFGEYTSLEVRREVAAEEHADAYRAALADVVAVLGDPGLVGGPGPWARWRLPQTIVELSGAEPARVAAYPRSRLALTVMPREGTESDDRQNGEYAEHWAPFYSWRSTAPHPNPAHGTLLGMMTYAHRPAEDWSEFERNLSELLATLPVDLPVLDGYAWEVTWVIEPADGRDEYVQGHFGTQQGDRLAVIETRNDWRRASERGEEQAGVQILNPTAQDGLHIAELALAEIHSWNLIGPDELRYRAGSHNGYRLDAFGLGLNWADD
ncbi:hypothetical protein ACPPVO_20800 [Dactylosporangium sp. McL0621]|uniref:hypothetical protein n=1 Tax=Dactylosporangium sp. McL0621 TaxID=3415678 RepID=UPI003CEAF7F9